MVLPPFPFSWCKIFFLISHCAGVPTRRLTTTCCVDRVAEASECACSVLACSSSYRCPDDLMIRFLIGGPRRESVVSTPDECRSCPAAGSMRLHGGRCGASAISRRRKDHAERRGAGCGPSRCDIEIFGRGCRAFTCEAGFAAQSIRVGGVYTLSV